jgi:nitrogen fixation/metabolism regulation signal transduction histidine kinase
VKRFFSIIAACAILILIVAIVVFGTKISEWFEEQNSNFDKNSPSLPSSTEGQSLESMKALGLKYAELPDGKVALNAPSQMRAGQPHQVEARVGIGVSQEKLEAAFKQGDQHFSGTAKVSYRMSAQLSGPSFKIQETTPSQQLVAFGVPTMWRWIVEAEEEGSQDLTVTLYAVVPNDNSGEVSLLVDTFTQRILVEVKELTWSEWGAQAKYFVEQGMGLWGTLAGAVASIAALFYAGRTWVLKALTRSRNSPDIKPD